MLLLIILTIFKILTLSIILILPCPWQSYYPLEYTCLNYLTLNGEFESNSTSLKGKNKHHLSVITLICFEYFGRGVDGFELNICCHKLATASVPRPSQQKK